MKLTGLSLIGGMALAALPQLLLAQGTPDNQVQEQPSEAENAGESPAEEPLDADQQQVDPGAEADPEVNAEIKDNLPNSHRWSIVPKPEDEAQAEDPDADLPPRLVTIEKEGMQGINGQRVNFAAARWQAQIYATPEAVDTSKPLPFWELSHRCGGTVIAQQWILTAAHCFKTPGLENRRRVRLGAPDISNLTQQPGNTYRILQVVKHPYYAPLRGYDIALIRFAADRDSGPNPVRSIVPIGRRDSGYRFAGTERVIAMGWGKTKNIDTDDASAELLKMALNVVPENDCQRTWGANKILSGLVICASAPGVATCTGDSGGPVIMDERNPVLVGVVSWGNDRCNGLASKPGVYTRISAYNDWINCVMRFYSNCASTLPPRRTN